MRRDREAGCCVQSRGCLAEVPSCCVVARLLLLNAPISDELNLVPKPSQAKVLTGGGDLREAQVERPPVC